MPGLHVITLLAVVAATFWLYTRPWIRMETVSLLLLGALLLLFHFFPFPAGTWKFTESHVLEAFGHPALISICSLMILGHGLTMTGALEPAIRLLSRLWRWNYSLGFLATLLVAAAASGFINDTPVMVLMLPMLQSLAERNGHPAAKTLMPLNFSILAGGMLTSVGTSTNLLVLSVAADLGMAPIGIFDFTPIAALSLLVAVPYLWLVAPRLLPRRQSSQTDNPRIYSARLVIRSQDSSIIGRTLKQLESRIGGKIPVVDILRSGARLPPQDNLAVIAGDELILNAKASTLREIASTLDVPLYDADGLSQFVEQDATRTDLEMVEAVIGTEYETLNRSISVDQFARQHGLAVIGISRGTEDLHRPASSPDSLTLAVGDLLLLQGSKRCVDALGEQRGLLVAGGRFHLPRSPRAPWALGIMATVMLVAGLKILPIHVAAFLGVLAMISAGCVKIEGLGRALSLEVVLIIASSIALGRALVQTGAAEWIAGSFSDLVVGLPPAGQLAAFMSFAALLTNFVSNSAAAAVGTPIAISAATNLGQPLEPFVLAILFGANLSFATPMAYQTNLLVMKAAGYTFGDFIRVGLPLVMLMLLTLVWLLVRHYGLA